MKIFLIVLALILAGIYFLTMPTINGLSSCYEEMAVRSKTYTEIMRKEKRTKDQFCSDDKEILLADKTCLSNLAKKNGEIMVELVRKATGILYPSYRKFNFDKFINEHNTVCSQFPKTLIEVSK